LKVAVADSVVTFGGLMTPVPVHPIVTVPPISPLDKAPLNELRVTTVMAPVAVYS